jgi:SprT protein
LSLKPLLDLLPEASTPYVEELILKEKLQIIISRNRSTKLGDYRPPQLRNYHRISVNYDLNPPLMLLILLHEYAHLVVFKSYGRKVSPHGTEWKNAFRNLIQPVLHEDNFPKEILPLLHRYFINPKASVSGAPKLFHALKSIGNETYQPNFLKDLPDNAWFSGNDGRIFQRIGLKRTRILCKLKNSRRMYLIHPYYEVNPLKA